MSAGSRRVARALASFAAVSLGLWISAQIWPHWPEWRGARTPVGVTAPRGTATEAPVAPATEHRASSLGTDASASVTPLKLILVATTPADTLSASTAALGTDRRNPQVHAGGAVLSNGARIEEIASDHIVLSLRGRRTTLSVQRVGAEGAPAFEATAPAAVVGGASVPTGEAPHYSSREDLSALLRPQPVFEGGRLAGLMILAGSDRSRLGMLGVESGDVVRSVDGRPIRSNADWQEIDDVLSSGGSIMVGIERNGALLSVSMDGARLAGGDPGT